MEIDVRTTKTALSILSLASAGAMLLASCSGPEENNPSPSESTASQTPTIEPTQSATPSAPATQSPKLSESHDVFGIHFMTPEGWTVKGDDCDGECSKWDEWEISDAKGKHVLTLNPTTATSPDGDPGLYERELLEQTELKSSTEANSKVKPTSLIAEFWESTSQEDGEKDTGFDIALVDMKTLESRTENPDLNYFIVGDQAPMFWVEDDYMEDFGVDDDPTKQQASQFLESEQYALIREIMLSVRASE